MLLAQQQPRTAGDRRPSLWFIVPCHGRLELARTCLRQLRRTCDTLTGNGVDASAIIIAADGNLDTARELGFGTVERDNVPLGRKWNDGYQVAGRTGVDYAVPFGSDDWIDPALILSRGMPENGTIGCHRQAAFVREDGQRIAPLQIPYDGGVGVRIIPVPLLWRLGYRPAEEDRQRAIDTSVLVRIREAHPRGTVRLAYHDLHQYQIVDWKSDTQLNAYRDCLGYLDGEENHDPWAALAEHYPAEALDEMQAVYRVPVAA
jgi:hypothetical protein